MTNAFKILIVGLAGGAGSIARYLGGLFVLNVIKVSPYRFPMGTFLINIIGSLLIGIIFEAFAKGKMSEEWRLTLAVGFCGGFTTFSSFAYENIGILTYGNEDFSFKLLKSILYIGLSLVLGILAVWAGMRLVKAIV